MNRIKASFLALTILTAGALVLTSDVHAACQLVDPINGPINITCQDARLSVSTNGVRSLPHPNDVQLGTRVQIKWVEPFSGNTQVQSWDYDAQETHFWQDKNNDGVWEHYPADAIMQEIGKRPGAIIQTKVVNDNGRIGWAVVRLNHLMIWNGGN
jgi:hypothetical protein